MKSVQVTGDKELIKLLQNLGSKVASQENRRATNLATTPILQAVKAGVPVDKGDLKKATIKKITNKNGQCNGIVGADTDYISENGDRPAHYDHLVEFGHVTKDGTQVPADPYMRNGWDNSIGAARAKYEEEITKGIEKNT